MTCGHHQDRLCALETIAAILAIGVALVLTVIATVVGKQFTAGNKQEKKCQAERQ
jgi:hypothetical protein